MGAGVEAERLLRQLADESAIRTVILRYCRAIDRRDAELLRSCYFEDAYDDHGAFKGGRDDFVEYCMTALREAAENTGQVTTHLIGNILIDLDGDRASVESYFLADHAEDRPDHFRVFEFHGRYLDRMERRSGEWRISSRTVVHDWSEVRANRRGLPAHGGAFTRSRPSPDDPVYGLGPVS